MNRDAKYWGALILKFRMRHCLTQKEFAKGCGISINEVAKLERQESKKVGAIVVGKLMNYMCIEYKEE